MTIPVLYANGQAMPSGDESLSVAHGDAVTITGTPAAGWSISSVALVNKPEESTAVVSSASSLPSSFTVDQGGRFRVRVVLVGPGGAQVAAFGALVGTTPNRAMTLLDETDDVSLQTRERLNAALLELDDAVTPTVADGSITTAKLADGAVTADKLAPGVLEPDVDYTALSPKRYVFGPTYWHDSVTAVETGTAPNNYKRREPFARLRVITSAPSLDLDVVAGTGGNDKIGIRVDGAFVAEYSAPAYNGTRQLLPVTLPVGADKVVDIVEACHGNSTLGVAVQAVRTDGDELTPVLPGDVDCGAVIDTDSIGMGYSDTQMTNHGWTQSLRWPYVASPHNGGLAVVGYGGRRLGVVAATPELRAELAAKHVALLSRVRAGGPKFVGHTLSTNDYAFAVCTPAQFRAYLADVISRTRDGDDEIRFLLQQALIRGTETAVGGYTLDHFRDAMAEVATIDHPDVCTLLAGKTILSSVGGDLAVDDLHPSDQGHTKVAAYWRARMFRANGFRYSEAPATAGVASGIWTGSLAAGALDGASGFYAINEGTGTGAHLINQVPSSALDGVAVYSTFRLAADTASRTIVTGNTSSVYVAANLATGALVGSPVGTHITPPTITPVTVLGRQFYDIRLHYTHSTGGGCRAYVDNDAGAISYAGTGRQILFSRAWIRPAVAPDVYIATTSAAIG